MTNNTEESSPQPQKAHLNQNLVIAIIGAVATLAAAIIPWVLDRAAQAGQSPTAILSTFTETAPLEATETKTAIAIANTHTPTLEPTATAIATATSTEETGIYNIFLAFDFEGTFIDDTFRQDQSVYLFFNFNDPKNRNDIEVVVSAVDVPGVLTDSVYYQIRDKLEPPNAKLTITKGKLPPGIYKVEIYLNNTLDETIEFTITK